MHFDNGVVPNEYRMYIRKKYYFLAATLLALLLLFIATLSIGSFKVSPSEVLKALLHLSESKNTGLVVFNIRLPQALTSLVAGAGLACSGAVMQSVLRNPLASPFTLGISNAAAFGASLSVILSGSSILNYLYSGYLGSFVTIFASFTFSLISALVIIYTAKSKGASPQVMVLTGIALGSLFGAGTMLIQYFADDVELAAMIFWTFGDTSRAGFSELIILSSCSAILLLFFVLNSEKYNAMIMGDETAKGLGVKVKTVRLFGMAASSLLTSVIISFVGIVSFVGLVAPHIVRKIIGDDHRFLIPGVIISGALILMAADIVAKTLLSPHLLPVSIFTSFLGAPVFIYLIIKGGKI